MWEKKPGTESVVAARKLAVQQRHADDVRFALTRNCTLNEAQAANLVDGFMRKELLVGHDKEGNEVTLSFADIVQHAMPLGISVTDDAFTIDMAAAIKAKGLDTSNTVFVDYAEMELRCCALAAKDMPVVKEAE